MISIVDLDTIADGGDHVLCLFLLAVLNYYPVEPVLTV